MSLLTTEKIEEIYPKFSENRGPRDLLQESGIVIVDKPVGISSMDVIRLLRRICKTKKMGHGGTLDPFATGVLPILINEATKKSDVVMSGGKEYEGTLLLGMEYDTQDLTGQALGEAKEIPASLTREKLEEVAQVFQGDILQVPPLYSAVKKNGRPLYKYARAGESVEREARPVRVEEFKILDWDGNRRIWFHAKVQKGVYLRTLAHDFGQKLGLGAVLETLRRTRVGSFVIEEAVQLSTLRFVSDIKRQLKSLTVL